MDNIKEVGEDEGKINLNVSEQVSQDLKVNLGDENIKPQIKEEIDYDEWMSNWADPAETDTKDGLKTERDYSDSDAESLLESRSLVKSEDDGAVSNQLSSSKKEETNKLSLKGYRRPGQICQSDEVLQSCQEFTSVLGSKCRYSCPFCQEVFFRWSTVLEHRREKHQGQFLPMIKFFSKIVGHVCRICSKRIICDLLFLNAHMKKHGLALKSYTKKFGIKQEHYKDPNTLLAAFLAKSSGTTDLVGNLCIFQCPTCKIMFQSLLGLRQHNKISSHVKGSLAQTAVKIVTHTCRICHQKVVSDGAMLGSHFSKHKLNILEYVKQFNLELTGSKKRKRQNYNQLFQTMVLSKEIGDLCTFACNICKQVFPSLTLLNLHLQRTQHGKLCHSTQSVLKNLLKSTAYCCKNCNELMICDTLVIRTHAHRKHKLKLRDYCEIFKVPMHSRKIILADKVRDFLKTAELSSVLSNKCVFRCFKCPKMYTSWLKLTNHLKRIHNGMCASYKRRPVELCDKSSKSYECNICFQKTLCDLNVFLDHLCNFHNRMRLSTYRKKYPDKRTEMIQLGQNIVNMCEYTCKECKLVYDTTSGLLQHFQYTGHGKSPLDGCDQFMTKHVLHKCKICFKNLKCEVSILKMHAKHVHKIDMNEYAKQAGLRFFNTPREALQLLYREIVHMFVERNRITELGLVASKMMQENGANQDIVTICTGSLSSFKCTKCRGYFSAWRSLRTHLQKEHDEITSFKDTFISKDVYHSCLLCRERVLCDSFFIQGHIIRKHKKIQYTDYKKLVELIGGLIDYYILHRNVSEKLRFFISFEWMDFFPKLSKLRHSRSTKDSLTLHLNKT